MKNEYNYLLFVPSLLTKTEPVSYRVAVEKSNNGEYPPYTGIQTNEAVTKFIIDHLRRQGKSLDKIIMLCTKEVMCERFQQVGGKTTYEYFTDEITKYMREKGYSVDPDIADIFEKVDYIPQNNENENQIIQALTQIIKPNEEKEIQKKLYVDFTGGNRSSALTLIFSCRILDRSNVEVGRILYSNLKQPYSENQGVIEECTQTYQIFSSFEKKLMIENDIIKENDNRKKSETEKRLDHAQKEMLRANRMNQQKQTEKKAKELVFATEKIDTSKMSYTEREAVKALEAKGKQYKAEAGDPLLQIKNPLQKKDYTRALNLYKEKIIEILYREQIISINKENKRYFRDGKPTTLVLDEIAAAYRYYEIGEHSFLGLVRDFLQKAEENIGVPPTEIRDRYFGDDFFELERYTDEAPRNGYRHNLFSRRKCDEVILPLMEDLYRSNVGLEELIKKYHEYEWTYMSYGFPFACTYGGQKYFDGYERLYRNNFKKGVESLQQLYDGKCDKTFRYAVKDLPGEEYTYEELIPILNSGKNEKELRAVFPFQLSKRIAGTDKIKKEEWNEFAYEFAKASDKIRNVRNKTIHPKDIGQKDIKTALEELRNIITTIEDIRK